MKKMLISILIIATILFVSGCAQNGDVPEEGPNAGVLEDSSVGSGEMDGDMGAEVTDAITESEETPNGSDNITISQEDLDRLKEELEGLEFEDVGGLSGD
ncbi:MAG: hypothetical protein K8R01_06560 [Methanococcoides sp.]|nr:hypothetical protein [Methanococcoides sp.]MCD4822809.1 hypothetical protein [Methanococcoides sp.]